MSPWNRVNVAIRAQQNDAPGCAQRFLNGDVCAVLQVGYSLMASSVACRIARLHWVSRHGRAAPIDERQCTIATICSKLDGAYV